MTDDSCIPDFKAHVFICTSCSYPLASGEDCDTETAYRFRKNLKSMAKEQWPKDQVRINASACLGQCSEGINCVIYPQNEWIQNLRKGQEEQVLKHLQKLLEDEF